LSSIRAFKVCDPLTRLEHHEAQHHTLGCLSDLLPSLTAYLQGVQYNNTTRAPATVDDLRAEWEALVETTPTLNQQVATVVAAEEGCVQAEQCMACFDGGDSLLCCGT
jgi:hypothetical protein